MQPFSEHVALFRKYPVMYILHEDYHEAAAFFRGADVCSSDMPLFGFKQFITVKLGGCHPLAWMLSVLYVIFPNSVDPEKELTSREAHLKAIEGLCDLILEYWEKRNQPNGLQTILDEYEAWLRQHSWYNAEREGEMMKQLRAACPAS